MRGARTEPYFQTDFSFTHELHVSKTNEARRLVFEANIFNLLNQRAAVGYNEIAVAGSGLISPTRAVRFPGDPGVDWGKVMNGYNYVDALNVGGTFAGAQKTPQVLASRYGMPQVFQGARNMRLALRFTF